MVDIEQHGVEEPPGLARVQALRGCGEREEIPGHQAAARVARELRAERHETDECAGDGCSGWAASAWAVVLPARLPLCSQSPAETLLFCQQRTMKAQTESFEIRTRGKGTYEITDRVARLVKESGVVTGTATVFIQHTSASLVIFENADRSARVDLEAYFERLVPEDSDYFTHTAEGGDDSTSHIRMVLTRSSEVIPIANGRLQLGTWQGIFLFEHRRAAHARSVVVNVMGV